MTTTASLPPRDPPVRRGFWRRAVGDPIVAVLAHGTSPAQVSRTLATGTVCSLFPFFGTTSALNLLAGLVLRMNQPILQTLNQLLGPVQVAMILVYVRIGEWLWGARADSFTAAEVMRVFEEASWSEFFARFGLAGLHALTAWAATAPLLYFAVLLAMRPVVRRLARRRSAREVVS